MSITAGDISEIAFSNPDVGSGFLAPLAEEASEYDLGGMRNAEDVKIDGAARAIMVMNQKPWMFNTTVANDMATSQEFETMNALASSLNDTVWTITHINGTVYKGTGKIVGDIKLSGDKATIAFKVAGGGRMAQA